MYVMDQPFLANFTLRRARSGLVNALVYIPVISVDEATRGNKWSRIAARPFRAPRLSRASTYQAGRMGCRSAAQRIVCEKRLVHYMCSAAPHTECHYIVGLNVTRLGTVSEGRLGHSRTKERATTWASARSTTHQRILSTKQPTLCDQQSGNIHSEMKIWVILRKKYCFYLHVWKEKQRKRKENGKYEFTI